jgi:hypothetical protein
MAGLGSGQSDPVQGSPDAAARARAAGRKSAAWIREEGNRLYGTYQQQTTYTKKRFWIVVLFVVAALVSIRMARGQLNRIGAHVAWNRDLHGELLTRVTNESAAEWTNIRLTLNDKYVFEKPSLLPGESVNANASQFSEKRATGAAVKVPRNVDFLNLRVACDQGSFQQDAR